MIAVIIYDLIPTLSRPYPDAFPMRSDTEQIPPDLSQPSDIHNAPKKLKYCKSIFSTPDSTVLALILLCSKVNNAVQYIGCETPASCVKDSSFTSFWQAQKLISLLRGSHSITTNALISIETNYDTLLNFGICNSIIFSDVHLWLSDMKREIIRIFVYYIHDLYIMQGFIHRSIYDASRCFQNACRPLPDPFPMNYDAIKNW